MYTYKGSIIHHCGVNIRLTIYTLRVEFLKCTVHTNFSVTLHPCFKSGEMLVVTVMNKLLVLASRFRVSLWNCRVQRSVLYPRGGTWIGFWALNPSVAFESHQLY